MLKLKEAIVSTLLVSGGVYVGEHRIPVVNEGPAAIQTCQLPNKCAKIEPRFESCVFPKVCKN